MRTSIYKKRKIYVAISLGIITAVILIRDPLLAKGINRYLTQFLLENRCVVESITAEGNCSRIKGVQGEGFQIKEAEVSWHLSLMPFRLEARIFVLEPVVISHKTETVEINPLQVLSFFAGNSFFYPVLEIVGGEASFVDEGFSVGFTVDPGALEGEIGVLKVKEKESLLDFMEVALIKEEKGFFANLQLRQADLVLLAQYIPKWNSLKGSLTSTASCFISNKGRLKKVQGDVSIDSFSCRDTDAAFSLEAQSLKGTLIYTPQKQVPLWKQIDLFLTFEDTSLLTPQNGSLFGFTHSLGEVRLHPGEDPYVKAFGSVISKGLEIPFEIEGKGELLDAGAYWLQSSLSFFLDKKTPTIELSLCQNDKGESILQAECSQITKEVMDLAQVLSPVFNVPEYSMVDGEIAGRLLGRFNGSKIISLDFSDCEAKGLFFSLPSKHLLFKAEHLTFQGVLHKEDRGSNLELFSSKLEMHKGDLTVDGYQFSEMASCFTINSGEIESSYIEGTYSGIKASLQLLSPAADSLFHLECGGYPKDLMKLFSLDGEIEGSDPILLALDIKEEKGLSGFAGTLRFSSSSLDAVEDLEFEGKLEKKITRKVKDLFSSWQTVFPSGQFHMNKISGATIRPYLPRSLKGIQGSAVLEGSFDRRGVEFLLKDAEVSFSDSSLRASCHLGDQEPVRLYFSRASLKWEGIFPVDFGFIEMKSLDCPIEVGASTFFLGGEKVWADEWSARIFDNTLSGHFLLEGDKVQIRSQKFVGKIGSIAPLVEKVFPSLDGNFMSAGNGLGLEGIKTVDGWQWSWDASISLAGIHQDFKEFGRIENGRAFVQANSLGEFSIKDAEAFYQIKSLSCRLALQNTSWKLGQGIDFSLSAKEGSRELLLVQGHIEEVLKQKKISLDSTSHILGLQCKVAPFTIGIKGELSPFDVEFLLKLRHLPSYLGLAERVGLISSLSIPSLDGDLQVKLAYTPATGLLGALFSMEELLYNGKEMGSLKAKIQKQGNFWKIYPSSIGPYSFQSQIETAETKWHVSSFSVESATQSFVAEGSYFPSSRKVQIPAFSTTLRKEKAEIKSKGLFEGDLSLDGDIQGKGKCSFFIGVKDAISFMAESSSDCSFIFDTKKGIEVGKSNWEVHDSNRESLLAKVCFPRVRIQPKEEQLFFDEASVTIKEAGLALLPKEIASLFISKEAQLQLEASVSSSAMKISGFLKNGVYQVGSSRLDVKQIRFLVEKEALYASCQTAFGKDPLYLQLRMQLQGPQVATVLVKDSLEKDPLNIQLGKTLENNWYLEGIKGEFKGLSIAVQRKGTLDKKGFLYETDLQGDFSKISSFFSQELADKFAKWKIGSGYRYLGSIFLSPDSKKILGCQGDVSGLNFEVLGKKMRSFKAKVFLGNDKFSMQNFTLEDDIALMSLKTAELVFNRETEKWALSVPLIHVKEFSPSLFAKGKKEGALIKNLSLYNLRGVLGGGETYLGGLQATGALNFVSETKKEFSFWDVPLSLIKDLGLDPGILSPVTGEVDFSLSRGKIYVTSLQNVYSEGMRSQFELAPPGTDSYLSLDGTWNVDLQMKQNVLWKVGERLVLSIRGNLEKPKYSFKFKESL